MNKITGINLLLKIDVALKFRVSISKPCEKITTGIVAFYSTMALFRKTLKKGSTFFLGVNEKNNALQGIVANLLYAKSWSSQVFSFTDLPQF